MHDLNLGLHDLNHTSKSRIARPKSRLARPGFGSLPAGAPGGPASTRGAGPVARRQGRRDTMAAGSRKSGFTQPPRRRPSGVPDTILRLPQLEHSSPNDSEAWRSAPSPSRSVGRRGPWPSFVREGSGGGRAGFGREQGGPGGDGGDPVSARPGGSAEESHLRVDPSHSQAGEAAARPQGSCSGGGGAAGLHWSECSVAPASEPFTPVHRSARLHPQGPHRLHHRRRCRAVGRTGVDESLEGRLSAPTRMDGPGPVGPGSCTGASLAVCRLEAPRAGAQPRPLLAGPWQATRAARPHAEGP